MSKILYEEKKEKVKAEPEEYFSDGARKKMIIKESVKIEIKEIIEKFKQYTLSK